MADLSFDDLIPSSGLDGRSRDLAVRTLLGEAANQGPEGLAAVAHVIRNRVQAGRYGGDSVPAVISKPWAFEPWMTDGGRKRMFSYAPESDAYKSAADIVDQVFSGALKDNTGGATHFVVPGNLGRGMPKWASGEPTATIGEHAFYAPEGRVGSVAKVESAPLSAPQAEKPSLNFDDLIPQAKVNQVDNRFPDPHPENPALQAGLEAAGPAMAGDKGALDAGARGAAQGATFNFYDELRGLAEAGGLNPDDPATLRSILTGAVQYMRGEPEAVKRYDTATGRERQKTKTAEELHPTASLAGNLAGAIAVPIGSMAGAATTGARVARGAKVGAVGGALAGAGSGENEQERISSGLTGAAAGAALGGTVGAALGRRGMPTEKGVQASDIFSTAKPDYRKFDELAGKIEIPEQTAKDFATRIRDTLDRGHFSEEFAKPVYSAIGKLEKEGPKTLDDLQGLKQLVGRGFESNEQTVRNAAAAASKEISKIINEVSPEAGKALKSADDIHSTARAVRELDRKFDVAGLRTGRAGYGGNFVNNMRQVISPIVQRSIEGKKTPFKPNEITALREFVEGDKVTNAARQVGAMSPSKGSVAIGMGTLTGGATAVAGIVGNKVAARLTMKQAERLRDLVAKRSPKYEEAVRKSAERYETAMDDFAKSPTSGRLAKLINTTRALSGGLNKDGIQITSGDLLKLLQAPATGRADEDEVPRNPSE